VVCTFSLLAKAGAVSTDDDFNAVLAIMVVPLPAAAAPVIYIINRILEDRRKQVETKLLGILKSKLIASQRAAAFRNH
jgi:hypothetical protein